MCIEIVALSTLLLPFVTGRPGNIDTGRLRRRGLVLASSRPPPRPVFVNGRCSPPLPVPPPPSPWERFVGGLLPCVGGLLAPVRARAAFPVITTLLSFVSTPPPTLYALLSRRESLFVYGNAGGGFCSSFQAVSVDSLQPFGCSKSLPWSCFVRPGMRRGGGCVRQSMDLNLGAFQGQIGAM